MQTFLNLDSKTGNLKDCQRKWISSRLLHKDSTVTNSSRDPKISKIDLVGDNIGLNKFKDGCTTSHSLLLLVRSSAS